MTKIKLSPDVVAANADLLGDHDIAHYFDGVPSGVPAKSRVAFSQSEHQAQADLFAWAVAMGSLVPQLKWLFAVPNGQYRPGQRMEPGLKKGVPDIVLPVAMNGNHGLFIELKVKGRKPSQEQLKWLTYLSAAGYETAVCDGWQEAARVILVYLGREKDAIL